MSWPLRPLMAGAGVAALALSGIMIAAPAAGSIPPVPPPVYADCELSVYRGSQETQSPGWYPVGTATGTVTVTGTADPTATQVEQPIRLEGTATIRIDNRGFVRELLDVPSISTSRSGSARTIVRYRGSAAPSEFSLGGYQVADLVLSSEDGLTGTVPLSTFEYSGENPLILTKTGTATVALTSVTLPFDVYYEVGSGQRHSLECDLRTPVAFATVTVERAAPADPETAVICAVWHLNASGRDEPVKLAEAALYGEQTANVAVNPTEVQVGERVRLTGQVDVAVQDPEFANRLDDLVSQHDTVHLLARYVRLTGTPEPDGPSAAMIALGSGGQLRYTPYETTYRFDFDDDVRAGMDLVALGGMSTEPVTLDEPGEVSFTVTGSGVVFGEADPAGARYALTCDNHTPLDLATVTVLAQATDPGNDEESAEVDDRQQETEQLAKTGSSTLPISLTGAALLAVGAGLTIAARRRRADRVE